MNRPLQCDCGKLRGQISDTQACTRIICYCTDCQAYARFLGDPARTLDDCGGTGLVIAQPRQLTFTQGIEHLTCMSLSPKGALRWYASCCNAAICTGSRSMQTAFVGINESRLKDSLASLESAFGPVRLRTMTSSATGTVQATPGWRKVPVMARFALSLLGARLGGSYRRTPLFQPDGTPIVQPHVIGLGERRLLASPPAAEKT